jgi:hypothetical protein
VGRSSSQLYEKIHQGKTAFLNIISLGDLMGDFMKSEIIQKEMDEIQRLQEEIFQEAMDFEFLPKREKLRHIDRLSDLLEKQKIMYTRLSLSDDPEAQERKEAIQLYVALLGYPDGTDTRCLFDELQESLLRLRDELDR